MPLFAAMVVKYRTTEEADGGGGGNVILAAATQQRQRRATDIGRGVDENDEGHQIWGWSVLKGFQQQQKNVGREFTRLLKTGNRGSGPFLPSIFFVSAGNIFFFGRTA
jgi:hypothetical protein